jgi:hypothetical protein
MRRGVATMAYYVPECGGRSIVVLIIEGLLIGERLRKYVWRRASTCKT